MINRICTANTNARMLSRKLVIYLNKKTFGLSQCISIAHAKKHLQFHNKSRLTRKQSCTLNMITLTLKTRQSLCMIKRQNSVCTLKFDSYCKFLVFILFPHRLVPEKLQTAVITSCDYVRFVNR